MRSLTKQALVEYAVVPTGLHLLHLLGHRDPSAFWFGKC